MRRYLAAGAVLAVLVGVLVVLVVPRQDSSPSSARPAEAGVSVEARAAARSLDRLVSDPASLVATSSQHRVGAEGARRAVPAGSKVVADLGSWRPDGQGGGVMIVTLTSPGMAPVSFAAVMVQEPTGWKVLQTIALEPATPVPTPGAS